MPDLIALFQKCVNAVLEEEGGLSQNPQDPGNWTGGKQGVGTLKGTKYGISAAAYPNEDIPGLTVERATAFYKRDYWDPLVSYGVPTELLPAAFECAVNQGMGRTKSLLEKANGRLDWFMAERALAYAALPTFQVFGRGWMRRLFKDALSYV